MPIDYRRNQSLTNGSIKRSFEFLKSSFSSLPGSSFSDSAADPPDNLRKSSQHNNNATDHVASSTSALSGHSRSTDLLNGNYCNRRYTTKVGDRRDPCCPRREDFSNIGGLPPLPPPVARKPKRMSDSFAEANEMLASALEQIDGLMAHGLKKDTCESPVGIPDSSPATPGSVLDNDNGAPTVSQNESSSAQKADLGSVPDLGFQKSDDHETLSKKASSSSDDIMYDSWGGEVIDLSANVACNGIDADDSAEEPAIALAAGEGNVENKDDDSVPDPTQPAHQSLPPASFRCPSAQLPGSVMAVQLARSLATAIRGLGDEAVGPPVDDLTRATLLSWLGAPAPPGMAGNGGGVMSPSPSTSTVSCPEYGDITAKLQCLEADRESLSLQVTVLAEQVNAQTEKIKDMEELLDDKGHKLNSTESMLQEELTQRAEIETTKLDLMAAMSGLKLKFASLEKDKTDTEAKLRNAQVEIDNLQRLIKDKSETDPSSGIKMPCVPATTGAYEQTEEIDKLKQAVQQLMAANVEKEQRIEELTKSLTDQQRIYKGLEDSGIGGIQRSKSSSSAYSVREDINEQLKQLLTDEDASELSTCYSYTDSLLYGRSVPPNSTSFHSYLSMPSSQSYTSGLSGSQLTPSNFSQTTSPSYGPTHHSLGGPAAGLPRPDGPLAPLGAAHLTSSSPHHQPPQQSSAPGTPRSRTPKSAAGQQLAAELSQLAPGYKKTPPYYPKEFGKPPRKPSIASGSGNDSSTTTRGGAGSNSGGTRGRGQHSNGGLGWLRRQLKPGKRSTSAPNLGGLGEHPLRVAGPVPPGLLAAQQRNGGGGPPFNRFHSYTSNSNNTASESEEDGYSGRPHSEQRFSRRDKKHRSLRDLLRIKRSSSQDLEDPDLGDGSGFRRGSRARATAGPRLGQGWIQEPPARSVPQRPPADIFYHWDAETLADWFTELGLGIYVPECRKAIRSGRHLATMSFSDYEKELGIRNPLHRKKLVLALRAIERGNSSPPDTMDYHQVLRWLDDIGLPQYRDTFAEARIDGGMLNTLTVEDLVALKITSALHHATTSRGIQILRTIGFNLNRLIRKFQPELVQKGSCATQVQLWSQHCVSEWLRSIDLAEFTPNLMCAGIHGALIVLEPLFTAETLANVLKIPLQKSLIRRHLTTHFNQLLGTEVVTLKRDFAAANGVGPLNPLTRVKIMKKGFSLSRRKPGKDEVYSDPDALICPLEMLPASGSVGSGMGALLPLPTYSSSASSSQTSSHVPDDPKLPESISEYWLKNSATSNV